MGRTTGVIATLAWLLAGRAGAATVLVAPNTAWKVTDWRYLVGEAPPAWHTPTFDDSAWSMGKAPFGYGEPGVFTSLPEAKEVHLRKRFWVGDMARLGRLILSVRCGGDCAAWINGRKVPMPQRYGHSDSYQIIEIKRSARLLKAGDNILAIKAASPRSESGHFVIDAGMLAGRNLALNKPAVASSLAANKRFFQPALVTDGTQYTFWESAHEDLAGWIYVDLGVRPTVDKVRLLWSRHTGATADRSYTIAVSSDSASWRRIEGQRSARGAIDALTFEPVRARFVRVEGLKANADLQEFEVYEKGVAFDPTEMDSLALDRPVTASSELASVPGRGFGPAAAITDGNPASFWNSHKSDNEWALVDLGVSQALGRAVIYWNHFATVYTLDVSDDRVTWRSVVGRDVETVIPDGEVRRTNEITLPEGTKGRYVRVSCSAPGPSAEKYGYGVMELSLFPPAR